jgi:hypothetical protein
MRFAIVGFVVSLSVIGCSGSVPYDFPSPPAGEPPPPQAGQGNGQTATSPPSPGEGDGVDTPDASVRDAGTDGDATVVPDAPHDARDAARDAHVTTCATELDCPFLQACLVNARPKVCGTNHDCSNGGLCNAGCCDQGLPFDTCTAGLSDQACGHPGEVCVDCTQTNRACIDGFCR